MRILFVDTCEWDYNVETAYTSPLGGTQSAVCYLSEALARVGHEVHLLTNTTHPGMFHSVRCMALNKTTETDILALNPTATIVIQAFGIGLRLRQILGRTACLVGWTGDDYRPGGPLTERLLKSDWLRAYDAVALASEWQRQNFIQAIGISPERAIILRYAIAPPFQNLFKESEPILAAKPGPAILAYTSTPFRGLEVLAHAFPEIRKCAPGIRLKVFSSMKVYLDSGSTAQDSQFTPLYQKLQQTEGVEYCGSLPQSSLAQHLREVQILAYPNIFDETSCIAVMEAMACGCQVVTSAKGALPETTAGFADLVPANDRARNYFTRYIDTVVDAIHRAAVNAELVEKKLREQVDFVNRAYIWSKRADEFISVISSIKPDEALRND